MKRPVPGATRLLAPAVALATAFAGAAAAYAGSGERCAGEPATTVGTKRDDTLRGTPRPDVIVAGGGPGGRCRR